MNPRDMSEPEQDPPLLRNTNNEQIGNENSLQNNYFVKYGIEWALVIYGLIFVIVDHGNPFDNLFWVVFLVLTSKYILWPLMKKAAEKDGNLTSGKIIIQKNEDNISNHEIENSTPISTKIHWFGLGVLLVSTIINLIGLSIELDSCTGLGCGFVSIFYLIVFWMISIIILVIAAIIKRKSKT